MNNDAENSFRDDAARWQVADAAGSFDLYALLAQFLSPEDIALIRQVEEELSPVSFQEDDLVDAYPVLAEFLPPEDIARILEEIALLDERRPPAGERFFAGSSTSSGASTSEIAGLEKVRYDGGSGDSSGGTTSAEADCAICIMDYKTGDELTVMACPGKHRFHRGCLGKWLRKSRSCPLCRHCLPV